MIYFIRDEKGSVVVNIITALSITAILTMGIVAAIFYVNTLFEDDSLRDGNMKSAYASKMDLNPISEIKSEDYNYLAKEGEAKLIGLSEEELKNNKNGKITIPEEIEYNGKTYKVTEIESGAFKDVLKENGIKEVEIPNSIRNIGNEAFSGNELEKINLPESLSSIGKSAFAGNNLKEISLPRELRVISDSAFKNNKIKNLSIPEKVEEIGVSSFAENNIEDIELGQSIKLIRENSFASNKLKELTLPKSVEEVRAGSFKNNKIMKVSTPENIKISDAAIDGRFGDAYFFASGEKGTYIREDEILYRWKKID